MRGKKEEDRKLGDEGGTDIVAFSYAAET